MIVKLNVLWYLHNYIYQINSEKEKRKSIRCPCSECVRHRCQVDRKPDYHTRGRYGFRFPPWTIIFIRIITYVIIQQLPL